MTHIRDARENLDLDWVQRESILLGQPHLDDFHLGQIIHLKQFNNQLRIITLGAL